MKHSLVFVALLLLFSCKEQNKNSIDNKTLLSTNLIYNPRSATGIDEAGMAKLATMDFKDSLYEFGTIREGEIVTHEFEFKNNGKSPLIISSSTGSCGCTVAESPREPIIPGQTAVIKVRFSSANKSGHQEKSVTIVSNSNRGNNMLVLKGEVKPTN